MDTLHPSWKAAAATLVAGAGAARLHRLARHSGATPAEVRAALPGDDIIGRPRVVWTRAATVHASPTQIWPWLVQMGYDRGGWYTNEVVDRLVWRTDPRNADEIHPEWQHLSVGDIVADGPDHAAYFRVRLLQPERALVYHSIRHPWRPHPVDATDKDAVARLERRLRSRGTYLDFTWAFVLRPHDRDSTRLLIRTRAGFRPPALGILSTPLGLVDAFHAHTILRGVARRAETWRPIPTPIP